MALQALRVRREIARHPVKQQPDAGRVASVDEKAKILRRVSTATFLDGDSVSGGQVW
jgi:hypothetical protein